MKKQSKLRVRSIFQHYFQFVRVRAWQHIWMLLAYALGALAISVAAPLIYKNIMDMVSGTQAVAFSDMVPLLYLLVATIVFYNIMFRTGDYLVIQTQSGILKDVADHAVRILQRKSYSFYTNSFTGGLVAKVKRFVRAFEELHDQFTFQIWFRGIELVAAVVVLWYFSWELGLIFLLWLVLYSVLVRYMVKWTIPKSLLNAEKDSEVTAHMSDIFTNILTVKMFAAGEREQCAYEKTTLEQDRARKRAWMQDGFWNAMFQGIATNMFEIVIIVAVLLLWSMQVASAGLVLLTVIYVQKSFNIVWQMSKNIVRISTALTDANELVEILDEPEGVKDIDEPDKETIEQGVIAFTHVAHRYENGSELFEDLNVEIQHGEKVALVGHSGSGKTTFVKLLLRFLDIDAGAITIDGQDITKLRQDDLRRKIAYVPQEPLLFHRSIFENIAYGNEGASRDEVVDAAKRAHAHGFIEALPKGYDTLVGERGVKLSGGERQRVAIARAMLKEAPIVVLDEATSSLDSVSERHIQAAFDELMKGRTTIVIAHRLSTIQHMDRILVLDKGAVAESGTHAELVHHDGIYAELWHSQVGGFLQNGDDEIAERKIA